MSMVDSLRKVARPARQGFGHADPGFTLRTYTHLLPSSETRSPKAIEDAFTEAEAEDKGDRPAARGTSVPPAKRMFSQCALAA